PPAWLAGDVLPIWVGFTFEPAFEGVDQPEVGCCRPEGDQDGGLGDSHHLDASPVHVFFAGVGEHREERLDGGAAPLVDVVPLRCPQLGVWRVFDWISTGTDMVVCEQQVGGSARRSWPG